LSTIPSIFYDAGRALRLQRGSVHMHTRALKKALIIMNERIR